MPERRRKKAEPVRAWCFVGAGLWAISAREDGDNLPPDRGPWRLHKTILLEGKDPEERAAEHALRENGFCCFAPDGDDAVLRN